MSQSPPFAITETTPGDTDFIRLFPAAERLFRDIVESWLVMEHDATTGRHKIPVGSTAFLAGLSYPADGALAYDETLSKFRVRVGNSFVTIGPEFPAGTRMSFQQTSAPAGWTKESAAAYNDAAVRIVTGSVTPTGGSAAFSTTFASRTPSGTNAGHALTAAQLPAHTHFVSNAGAVDPGVALDATNTLVRQRDGQADNDYTLAGSATTASVGLSSSVGSDSTHTHTFTGNAMDFAVKFADMIIAQKD